jgi:Tfp pilus assembly protein PilV
LGVFISIVVIMIALLLLFIVLYVSLARKRKETSVRVAQLQRRVTELSSVYEELDPRASMLLSSSTSNNNGMDTTDNNAYNVPRIATMKVDDPETPLSGEAYEIMRSVSRKT